MGIPSNYKNVHSGLFRAGGYAALTLAVLMLAEMIIYLTSSPPGLDDPSGWFNLFQTNRLLGLLDLGLLELAGLLLYIPMLLALYFVFKPVSQGSAAAALCLGLISIAVNFSTSKLTTIYTLSDLHAAAAEPLKAQLLVQGKAALAVSALGGISGSLEGTIPLTVCGLIFSIVMLRANLLGRAAGIIGLLANGFAVAMVIRAFGPLAAVGNPFFGLFFIFTFIWYFLVGIKLLRMK